MNCTISSEPHFQLFEPLSLNNILILKDTQIMMNQNLGTRKRKFNHETFLQPTNIHPDQIEHITKKVKLNSELIAPERTFKSMNNLMRRLTLDDQTNSCQNNTIEINNSQQLHRSRTTNFKTKIDKSMSYITEESQKEKDQEFGNFDFNLLLCKTSNLMLEEYDWTWNIHHHFKSELKILESKEFEEMFGNLKVKISEYLSTVQTEYLSGQEIAKKTSQEVQDTFVMIFKRIIFDLEELWNFLSVFLKFEYALPSPEVNIENKGYNNNNFQIEEEIEQSPTFFVTLTNGNVHDLPLLVIKIANDEEYHADNETDAILTYFRVIAQKANMTELYGLIGDSGNIRFMKYENFQGQSERLLQSTSIPFALGDLAGQSQWDWPLKVIICMLLELVKKYNTNS